MLTTIDLPQAVSQRPVLRCSRKMRRSNLEVAQEYSCIEEQVVRESYQSPSRGAVFQPCDHQQMSAGRDRGDAAVYLWWRCVDSSCSHQVHLQSFWSPRMLRYNPRLTNSLQTPRIKPRPRRWEKAALSFCTPDYTPQLAFSGSPRSRTYASTRSTLCSTNSQANFEMVSPLLQTRLLPCASSSTQSGPPMSSMAV